MSVAQQPGNALETVSVSLDNEDEDMESGMSILNNLPTAVFEFSHVDRALKEAFNFQETNCSMICDIMAVYLKGQKLLYTEAKTLCETRLDYLMIPTIVITAVCTIISTALKDFNFSSTLVSSLNGLNFFFLTLINFLKLDAKAEAHRVSAYKFDKLQSKLEFSSGKILFIAGESRELPKLISDTEKAVEEIKETNQFILPEYIRYSYPNLVNTNVFTEVKRVQTIEIQLINELKDILNEHVNLNIKIHSDDGEPTDTDRNRLAELDDKRKELTRQIIDTRNKYLKIDGQIEYELRLNRNKAVRGCNICNCLKT
jgi:hypothetical protein